MPHVSFYCSYRINVGAKKLVPNLKAVVGITLLITNNLLKLTNNHFVAPHVRSALVGTSKLYILFVNLNNAVRGVLVVSKGTLTAANAAVLVISFTLNSLVNRTIGLRTTVRGLNR